MRPRRRGGDHGNAMVEFTWLAILLMVPLVYFMLAVFEVQKTAYAVEAASREAGRAFVTSDEGENPDARAVAAGQLAARDQGVRLSAAEIRPRCVPASQCLVPGTKVRVVVETEVSLPFVPAEILGRSFATVQVDATHVAVVDTYRDAPVGEDP